MSQVFIAAGIIGWSAIALSISSCSSSSNSMPAAQNATDNLAPSPITASEQIAPVENRPQSLPIPAPAVTAVAAKSPDPVPVPYVNPLSSITLLAQKSAAHRSGSNSTSFSNPVANSSNVQSEQLNNIAAQPKKYQPNRANVLTTACRAFPCLILSQDPSYSQNRFNNPIYRLSAYRNQASERVFQFNAVTGRGFTQARNRYQSNTEAPLPDGSYSVAARVVAGTIREVGGTMVPIFPKPGFDPRMRRTALGIHWDPSFDKDKKEDGTSGCIGLTSKSDYHRVRDFILKYRPRSIEVQITRSIQ
jgi:hypothetical protein